MEEGPTSPALHKKQTSGETFCGADRGNYKWSQTIKDLDVLLPVSDDIVSASCVKVATTTETIRVFVKSKSETEWRSIMDGKLSFKIKPAELVWTLEPRKHITVLLEKTQERWWDSLLESEPKLNLEEYELTRPITDLSEEEEMTLQKIWKKQLEKKNGLERHFPF